MQQDLPDLQFGPFVLSRRRRLLARDGAEISLTPKAFDTLAYLASHPGEMVEKQELMNAVWENVFVDESTLTQNIFTIRKALGDASQIETLPRKGYRFSATVTPVPVGPPTAPANPPASSHRLLAVCGMVVVLASGLALWASRSSRKPTVASRPLIRSIAVLPLRNLSGDPQQEYFSDGITEALITDLAQIHSLAVTSRTSIVHYKTTTETAAAIGRELGVDALLEGSVQSSGGRVRITAQLIRADIDKHIWANDYERDMTDVLKLEGEVARTIAREIQTRITPEEDGRLEGAGVVKPEAYQQYLLGRYYFWKSNPDDVHRAIEYFERAVQLQPDYAAAYAELASSWQRLSLSGETPETREGSRKAAVKALELDPSLAEGHAAMGGELMWEWDWAGAERELKRALELDPNSLITCQCYGNLLILEGRIPEAISVFEQGLKADPLSASMYERIGSALYNGRKYQEALPYLRRALEIDPDSSETRKSMALNYEKLGRLADAVAVLNRPEFRSSGLLAREYALMGRRSEALQILDLLTKAGSNTLSLRISDVYFALGDKERGFEWLKKSIDRREFLAAFSKFSPRYDETVRSDPRFKTLVARFNIPD